MNPDAAGGTARAAASSWRACGPQQTLPIGIFVVPGLHGIPRRGPLIERISPLISEVGKGVRMPVAICTMMPALVGRQGRDNHACRNLSRQWVDAQESDAVYV
jgi:hypothetical protein